MWFAVTFAGTARLFSLRRMPSANNFNFSTAFSVFFASYAILLSLPGFTLVREEDTLWQVRTGQWIIENAKVPVSDFYSYTSFGKQWISGQWLSELWLALAFNIGHWRGVVLLSAIACAATFALLSLYLVRNLRFSLAIGWVAVTLLAIVPHCVARPHIFSYVILLLWIVILLDTYDNKDFRPSIPILCLLMVLWANLHGSFTIGLLLLYIFAGFSCYAPFVERNYSSCANILFMLLVVSASALLTPYGAYSALLVLQVMNMKFVQSNVIEWMAPNFQEYIFYLCYLVGIFTMIVGLGIRLCGARLFVFSMMMLFALSHIRGLLMLFLLAPVILARPILERAPWLRAQSLGNATPSDPILLYLHARPFAMPAIFLGVAALVTAYTWDRINVGPPRSSMPAAAVDFIRKAGITGNVFNSYSFGGYLIFVGIPTFIDGRTPPHSDDFVRRYSDAVNLRDIDAAFKVLDEYKVRWALLHPEEPLAKALARSPLWNEVYSDNYSVVFVRR